MVRFDAGRLKLQVSPLADLTDRTRGTTQRGAFIVRTNDPAKRLADLIGTPPPEETAKAPRTNEKQERTNKAKLRISRPKATKKTKGTGLNITTGGY